MMSDAERRGPGPGLLSRADVEQEERARLAPWASMSGDSRGRLHPEPEHAYRTRFARDRDRIVHSRAFRRLEYKTQVFVYHEGDHYRNRLTHTIEGSQIARTLARTLRLNEDLAEAVVLAHDLGHTPFGHAGEHVLDGLLAGEGGFDHNRQTLRIVDWLEERYPAFRGLNLTHETREGILKHGSDWPHPVPVPERGPSPSLEAQVADHADEIAYLNHDLDDGLRSGLLGWEQLQAVTLWAEARAALAPTLGDVSERVLRAQLIRALLDRLVTDLAQESRRAIGEAGVTSPDEVRRCKDPLVRFSREIKPLQRELKEFLYDRLYHHERVLDVSRRAEQTLGDLYRHYRAKRSALPPHVVARFGEEGEARAIADYIAGMTDRFALAEHEKLRA
jgi:dGTPase